MVGMVQIIDEYLVDECDCRMDGYCKVHVSGADVLNGRCLCVDGCEHNYGLFCYLWL